MASSRLVLPEPVGPWMRKSPSAESASTSTTTRSANGPNASISSRCTLTRRPPTRWRRPRRRRPGGRPGWPRRPRRAGPARRRWRRDRRARGPRKSQQTSTSVAVATRAAYGRSGTVAPCGSKRSSRVNGKRRRTWSIAPSGRCGSVRVTWHQAASAPRCAGSASSCSRVPRSTASGRSTGRLDVLDDRGARRRGRPAGCPCGASTRRTTSPRGSRCSARRVRPPGGRAGGPARCSRCRRRRRAARPTPRRR